MKEQKETQLATKKEWLALLVLALPCVLYSMDLTVLNLALPQLSLDLKPSASQLLWIVDIYGFFLAGSLITMGNLGDRIGRRKMLLIGSTVFALASALAAFSKSSEMLIFTRALQGIAGAVLAPSTLSLIRVLFKNPGQRAQAIGLWGASFSLGALVGPLVGGMLIEHFWWGAVFLINLPIMILLLIVAPKLLPEYKDPASAKIDLLSAGMSLVAILSVILGLKKIAEGGDFLFSAVCVFIGLIIGILFVRRQKSLQDPLVDLKLFRTFEFRALLFTNSMTMFAVFGSFIYFAQFTQLVIGLSPLTAGLWSLPQSFGMILSSSMSPLLVQRFRPSTLMGSGLLISASGFLLASQVQGANDLYLLVVASTIFSLGVSPVLLFTTNMLVNSAPPEKAGAAAALSETGNELGGATGIAILGSIGAIIYRANILKNLPNDLPEKLRLGAATTIENAMEVAREAGPVGEPLIQHAKASFTTAFQTVMLITAVALILISILIFTRLRHVKLEAQHEES